MFSHIATTFIYAVATSAIFAAAMPWATTTTSPVTTTVTVTAPATTVTTASQCNTGDVQCCNSVQSSSSAGAATLLGLLGVVLQGVAVPIGITCSPITAIGAGANSCTQQPVCCENNSFKGVIAIGCTPINLSL